MRAYVGLALALTLVVSAGLTYSRLERERGYSLAKGTVAPPFRLPSLAGPEVDLQTFRGSVVVLNFWATWCPPCVAEMPSLERLHRETAKDGVVVLTVSVDEDGEALADFVRARGLTLPVLRDPSARVSALYHVTGFPETFILEADGSIRDHVIGAADWATPEALSHIRGSGR